MFIQRKQHLRDLKRVRVSEGRNLAKGLRLDRNEKVDVWPKDFLKDILDRLPQYYLSVYPDNTSLYEKLSHHLGLTPQQLMLTSGIDGGLKAIFEVVTSPGDVVGVLSPTYAMYKVYSNMFQVRLFEIGYRDDFSVKTEQIDEFLALNPAVLFVPNPNQPIESALSLAELDALARRTYERNCLFLVDEAYYMFGSETGFPLLKKYEHVVIARTFSKAFGVPSIRLGYLASTLENMDVLGKTRFAHESNALSNAVAEYLLDHFDTVEAYCHKVIKSRESMKKDLRSLGLRVHGNKGNYLLIDLHSKEIAEHVVRFLRDNLIYVKGPWSEPWDRYITITLGPEEIMSRFLASMKIACERYVK